jgi:hypothetical protein
MPEQCWNLPDRLLILDKFASGCDEDNVEFEIPGTIILKMQREVTLMVPMLLNVPLAIDRHVRVRGMRLTRERGGIISDIELLGAMSKVTVTLDRT